MPRKNQRRKNVNSHSGGQRKAKPIKFNPCDLEEEQKRQLDIESIENDAIDMQSESEITTVYKMITKQEHASDNVTNADESTGKCHSMVEPNNTVQEVAVIEIPAMNTPSSNQPNEHAVTTTNNDSQRTESNLSFVQSNEPNERFRMGKADTETLSTTNMNANILMGNETENIQNKCDNGNGNDNNNVNSQTESLLIKMTESTNGTNDDNVNIDINGNMRVSSEIIVLVPERDVASDKNMNQRDDTLHAIDQIESDPVFRTDDLVVDMDVANMELDQKQSKNAIQNTPDDADHLNLKQQEQAQSFQNNTNAIEIDQQPNRIHSHQKTEINTDDMASALKPESLQINRTEVVNKFETLKTDMTIDLSREKRTNSSAKQSYHVKSPELKEQFESPIRKSRSMDDSSEFNIQELSDCGSSAAENTTPHISEVESELESDSNDAIESKQFLNNRLISIETCPLNETDLIESEKQTKCENPINDAECKRQKRSTTSHLNAQYLQPPLNGLQAISEENSDASDIENDGKEIENQDKSNETKANKTNANANVSFPKSKYDFSHIGRHTNLLSPSTDVIREEPQCILVDAKIVEPKNVAEGNRSWTTTMAEKQNHAELIYLDSSSSNTSLSDIESATGNDGDIEDINSDYDVRIETPIIGSNVNSAFTPIINKKSPAPVNSRSGSKHMLVDPCDNSDSQVNEHTEFKIQCIDKTQNNQQHEPASASIDNTFKPINENDCSIRTLLEYIANASTPSTPFDDDNDNEFEPNNMLANNNLILDSTNSMHDTHQKHEHNQIEIEIENQNQLDQTQPNEQHQKNIINNVEDYNTKSLTSTSHMFPSIDTNFVEQFNLCESSTVNNSEFNRQESVSSHCSSHTESTTHSQCTAQYIASETSPNEFIDFHDGHTHAINLKTLRQLCTERVALLPYGQLILEELAKYSKELASDMPYPAPKLPRITDLEIHSELMHQPKVPPRTYQSKIKFVSNFLVKSSPSPPPVPNRPWLGIPTAENPNVLVCLSPAQRQLYQAFDHNSRYNSRPDQLLDMHNKFVDRRGYYEYTDEEVNAINSRKSVTSAESDAFSNMKTKDDNKLLALIREINQLTDNRSDAPDENSLMTQQRSGHSKSGQQKHIDDDLPQKQSDHTPLNMDSNASATATATATAAPNSFHSKRFSHYFDDLNRLHTISEEVPKFYSNCETKTFESCKRIGNDEVDHNFSDSSHEKITNTNNQTTITTTTSNIQSAFDLTTDKQLNDGEFFNKKTQCESTPKQYVENQRYCKFDESKNSREANSQKPSYNSMQTSNIDEDDESLNKSATTTTINEEKIEDASSRFSFKDFDFVPKIFTNFFRSNKLDSSAAKSEQTVSIITKDDCVISDKIKRSSPLSMSSDLRKGEDHHLSTQSLYDWFSGDIPERSPSRNNLILNVAASAPSRGRISPNPIRAPRIVDPNENLNINKTGNNQNNPPAVPQRHYDWNDMKTSRNFESRQSMIDQTPITRVSMMNARRRSLPKALADTQLANIMEKEKKNQLANEFDKLETSRMRLIKELEEMQVNQSFEDFYKAHKKRNSLNPDFSHLSDAEMLRKEMQDEWLSKVAEREERRLQKIIKVSHSLCETESPATKSLTNRGLCDEFLERVKERRTKLQMPSDSDWESGAESQPIKRNDQPPIQLNPNVKIIDGGHEADLKNLPKHIREFAELTTEQIVRANEIKQSGPFDNAGKSKEIIHTIERCDNTDGIWSPSGTPQPTRREFASTENPYQSEPSLAHQSHGTPIVERREFRSVKFESPSSPRKIYTPQINTTHSASTQSLSSSINAPPPTPPKSKEHQQHPSLESVSGSTKIRSYYPAGVRQTNDANYSHNEYVAKRQHLENERHKNMDRQTGIDVTSRSEANEGNQHEWYKKMYNTIHKVSDGDGYVTVRYKTRKGQYPYKSSSNGYASEPERGHNSDYSIKYKTLDRRRIPSSENVYATLTNPMKPENSCYKNHPGKIEDFTPGHSSAIDKQRREEQFKLKNDIHKVCEGNLSRALKDQGYESDSTLVFRKKENSQLAPLSPVEQKQAYLNLQAGGEAPMQGFRKPAPEKPKECDVVPPPPPPVKGYNNNNFQHPDLESARRYIEGDVNIHYKTPVRYELKDPISDAELIHRQEQMKKLYQEERRRKYLQELQDLNNRRHGDNFTPSQKSPIPLNRYDDFGYEYSVKSTNYPRIVARALYNFQGQSSRELSFKKGDTVYIRREIDKNWYEGEHNATVGLLPANYVEIVSKDGVRCPTKKPTEGQARAKFNFQAQSAIELSLNKGELVVLTRRVDDNWFEGRIANRKGIFPVSYVEVLTDIGVDLPIVPNKPIGAPAAHSLITSTNHQLSPQSNYSTDVTTTTNILSNGQHSPVVRETSKSIQKTEVLHVDTNSEPIPYRAVYKYRPQNSDELELQEGDTVFVLEKCDDGWFVGTSQRTGYFGTFPGNYVERI